MILNIVSAVFVVVILVVGIVLKIKNNKLKKLQVAALDIMKEEALNGALQNQWAINDYGDQNNNTADKKMMIHLEVKGSKPVISYVFNPEKVIHIGRNKESNTICLKDTTVSGQHCDIYANEGGIYIKDLGSSNKTLIKRRSKIIEVENLCSAKISSKDRIYIGSTCFKITLFQSNIVTF